jgi:hypothetical protein
MPFVGDAAIRARPAQLGVCGRGEQREEKQYHSITIGKAGLR